LTQKWEFSNLSRVTQIAHPSPKLHMATKNDLKVLIRSVWG
jgi:hypothetical protein